MRTKIVGGKRVLMNSEEEEEFIAEQLANELPDAINIKISKIKSEGQKRINAVIPGIKDIETLMLIREQWLSIAPAARQATASFKSVIDIYQAASDAITEIKTMIDITTIELYDVVIDPGWPS